ncbi:glycosyltransferase [Clostridium perfringens]
MNILVIPSWYENKNNKTHGSFFREQAKALSELGHNIYMLYVDIIRFNEVDRIITTKKYDFYEDEGMKVYRKKVVKIPKTSEVIVANKVRYGIEDLYNKYIKNSVKIDVIHAHSFIWAGYAGVSLSKKFNIPIMVTEHYTGYSRNIFSDNEKKLISYSMNNCDKCISVSSGLKNDMTRYTSNIIKVIPNMVDTKLFKFDSSKKYVNNKFLFVSVCYLMKKKGIDVLLKAFKLAFEECDDVELRIGGDGEERENLELLAKKLGIESKVKFVGALERNEVVNLMSESQFFVLPSRFETFGVVYIEALALGKPVIATKTDAIVDIIDESNGLIVEKENIEQLKKALIYIKNNYNQYKSSEISSKCIKNFSTYEVSKKIEKELINIINNGEKNEIK